MFLQKDFAHIKSTKKKKKTHTSEHKIKNALKKQLRGKKSLIRLFAFLCSRRKKKKSLYNENIGFTKLVKVLSALYKQKLVY